MMISITNLGESIITAYIHAFTLANAKLVETPFAYVERHWNSTLMKSLVIPIR
jgi:hypothetical protein